MTRYVLAPAAQEDLVAIQDYYLEEAGYRANMKLVAIVQVPETNQTPTEDPHYPAAVERVKAAVRELLEKGIVDPQGRRIRKELPPDMQEAADRDCTTMKVP